MKVTITSNGASKEITAASGQEIQVKAGDKIHLTPDADNPAVIILPNGTDLVVMLADGTWITLVGANDPGVVGQDGGIEVSVEGIGTVISAENSFTSYQGILLNNSLGEGINGTPFYEPVSDLNDFFLLGLAPLPVLQGLQQLFGVPGMPGLVIGDKLVFVGPPALTPALEAPDAPEAPAAEAEAPVCGVALFGAAGGGSTLTGTACDDGLFAFRSGNTLTGLAGNDTLMVTDIVADTDVDDYADVDVDAFANNNILSGGDGNDVMSVSAEGSAKAKAYSDAVAVDDVELELDVVADADADANNNTLSGGDGNDVMSVSADAKSYAGADADADAESPAFASAFAVADADAKADAKAYANNNTLSGGDGDDTMSVSAYAESFAFAYADADADVVSLPSFPSLPTAFADAFAFADADADAKAYANNNILSGGDGNDVMSVSADAVAVAVAFVDASADFYAEGSATATANATVDADVDVDAGANNNMLSGGDGNDDMSVSAGAFAGAFATVDAAADADAFADADVDADVDAEANNNTLSGGDGNDDMSVSAGAFAGAFAKSYADAEADAEADADADADAKAEANNNTLSGGEGNDVMSVSAYAEASAYADVEVRGDAEANANANAEADENTLSGGAGDDNLSVTADSYAYSNSFEGLESSAVVASNILNGDEGDDTLTVRASDTSNPGTEPISIRAVVNANVLMGGDGNDVLEAITEATFGGAGGGVYDNSLYGGADGDQLTVRSDTQSAQELIDDNVLDGGADEDTLSVDAAGDVTGAGGITDIEVLDLNNNEANAISLDAAQVISMTDGDNVLRLVTDDGIGGDTVDFLAGASWTDTGFDTVDGYNIFTQGGATLETTQAPIPPVVLDLNGDGIAEFTAIGGNRFDVDGDGELENISWAGAGDAVLAFDANGDGMISSLEEIAFASYVPGATSDLEGLTAFDTNNDGLLSAEDDDFDSFFVWQESNFDGVGSGLELMSLADAGIQSINLELLNDESYVSGQAFVQGTGEFTWDDGSTGMLADAIFLTSEKDPVDLDGVLDDEAGDEALVAAMDGDGSGGGGGSGDDVPVIPDLPSGETDPLDPTEDEIAAV
ncbi:MAG: hypothetical protein GXP30_11155 [Verrucomicrobia bacterium]|nr:hypothetical protein [Verrucomicrobiota bacterium]